MSEKEKNNIRAIENSSLNLQSKQDLLLVYLKERPSSSHPSENKYYKKEFCEKEDDLLKKIDEEKKDIRVMLESLEIPFYFEEFEEENKKPIEKKYRFLVGRSEEDLENLKEALRKCSAKEIGTALGYPKTSVDAFVEGEILDKYDDLRFLAQKEKEDLKKEQVFKFVSFGLSKQNWRSELDLVRRYQMIIKEKAPKLYSDILEKRKDLL